MWLDVNGKRMQTGNTRTMIFGVAQIVSHVSQYMTLLPGDVITTGTPPGVGMGDQAEPGVPEAGRRGAPRHPGPRGAEPEGRRLARLSRGWSIELENPPSTGSAVPVTKSLACPRDRRDSWKKCNGVS